MTILIWPSSKRKDGYCLVLTTPGTTSIPEESMIFFTTFWSGHSERSNGGCKTLLTLYLFRLPRQKGKSFRHGIIDFHVDISWISAIPVAADKASFQPPSAWATDNTTPDRRLSARSRARREIRRNGRTRKWRLRW